MRLSPPISVLTIVAAAFSQFEIIRAIRRHPRYIACMETTLERLRKILALLGPGIFLEIDQNVFFQAFGGEMTRETAEVAADRFARENHCTFDRKQNVAKFGRAYPKAPCGE